MNRFLRTHELVESYGLFKAGLLVQLLRDNVIDPLSEQPLATVLLEDGRHVSFPSCLLRTTLTTFEVNTVRHHNDGSVDMHVVNVGGEWFGQRVIPLDPSLPLPQPGDLIRVA